MIQEEIAKIISDATLPYPDSVIIKIISEDLIDLCAEKIIRLLEEHGVDLSLLQDVEKII
jgi:hypothetical protein